MKVNKKITRPINENTHSFTPLDDELMDVAEYLYKETDTSIDRQGYVQDITIPDFDEAQYYADISNEDYDKIVSLLEDSIRKVRYYDGNILLNDNHTLWDLNVDEEDFNLDDYQIAVDDACQRFEEITGVEIFLCGRSGRRVCVEDTLSNVIAYESLQEVQEKLENELIKNYNASSKSTTVTESKVARFTFKRAGGTLTESAHKRLKESSLRDGESLKEDTDEILVFKRDVNSAEDVDDIQYAIQKLSDGVAEDALQSAFNEAEGKDIDAVKNAVISALDVYLEDNEWLGEAVEEDDEKPYTYTQVLAELKSITKNFTDKKGMVKCGYKEEAEHAEKILGKYYESAELDKVGSWFQIDYAGPLKGKKVEESAPLEDRKPYRVFAPGDRVVLTSNKWHTDSQNDNIGRKGTIVRDYYHGAKHGFQVKADDIRKVSGYDDTGFNAYDDELDYAD